MNNRFEQLQGYNSIRDLLIHWAKTTPKETAYVYLQERTFEEKSYNFQHLYIRSLCVAAKLQATVAKGDRVLLLFPSGLEFIESFLGCLMANVIAVPAYLPRNKRDWQRVEGVLNNCKAKVVLSNKQEHLKIADHLNKSSFSNITCIDVEDIEKEQALHYQKNIVQKDDIAMIQYTSGSTGQPKGVMVSHYNLLHNQMVITSSFRHDASTRGFGWLPLYHDMGLIGNVLNVLVLGIPLYFMSPYAFVQKPFRWLDYISRYKVTSSGGPNFAYDLCVKKITDEEISQLDLSCWTLAFCGSEPIRSSTLKRFVDRFSVCGFKSSSILTCYGMAENTLMISGSKTQDEPKYINLNTENLSKRETVVQQSHVDATTFVGCGSEFFDQEVKIIDPDTKINLHEKGVGEVWVKGKSVTLGYWNNPEKTEEEYHAYTSDTGEGPFFRTGDLGFIKEGELYITGRIKDVIIINGCNYVPQDIEKTTFNVADTLIVDGSAAFPFTHEEKEKFVVVQEVERTALLTFDADTLGKKVRQQIFENHQLVPHQIVFIKPANLPRTSSGKIQRQKCKQMYETGELKVIGAV